MRFRGVPFHPSGPADSLSQGIAMVHQHFSLEPDMTVVDNVLLGRERGVLNRKHCATQLEKLAVDYGLPLDPYAKIEDLSVGERQRVEIVKCLIRDPSLFVLDEPTAVLLPDEIAAGLVFLASDAAAHVTAHTLVIDSGVTAGGFASGASVLRNRPVAFMGPSSQRMENRS